jgi:SpoVK/Ycf46/Vps4 family AAA+-type ATPase
MLHLYLDKETNALTEKQFQLLSEKTLGFSGADIKVLCTEASLGPIRCLIKSGVSIETVDADQVRPISFEDFEEALQNVRPSVSESDLNHYLDWNEAFGSIRTRESM